MSQYGDRSDLRTRNLRRRESTKLGSSGNSTPLDLRDLAESLHRKIMADFSKDEDPDSMFRKRHATPPTPRFEADISPASAGFCVRQQRLGRQLRTAQAASFQSRTRGRTDQRDLSVNVKTRSKSPVYQVPSVKQWTPIQLSSAPSRFRPLKSLAPGALPETYTARHCVLRQNCVVKVIDLRSFVGQNSGVWSVYAEIQALRRIQRSGKLGFQQLSMFPFNPDIWFSSDAYLYFILVSGMILSCICVDMPFFRNGIPIGCASSRIACLWTRCFLGLSYSTL
jgi:hypothetical protein